MINRFLEKTRAGELTVGTFFEMGHAAVGEVIGQTELDYFIIDCEHGPYDIESAGDVIRAAEGVSGGKVTPFARSRDSGRASILKLLDIGAKGIIIPHVQSLEEAKKIVEYGKYFPVGDRGVAVSRSVKYGLGHETDQGTKAWFEECNEKELLIPQCETVGCLDQIEEIMALDGIDGIFVGPYDLSASMGIPAEFDSPRFLEAIKRIIRAVKAAGKFGIIYVDDETTAAQRYALGYNSVTIQLDSTVYFRALNKMVDEVRKAVRL